MKLVAYARVSSLGQKDNTSLEHQVERIENYARMAGHEIVLILTEAQSASGEIERKKLQQALKLIYSGEADGLIAYKLDRFARSTMEGLRLAQELHRAGKHLVVLDLNVDTSTPMGEMIFTVILAFAQLERKIIKERATNGKNIIRARDGYVHGQPPYGWVAGARDGQRTLLPDEHEQKYRAYIQELRKTGLSYQTIADILNKEGVKAKCGGSWYWASVRQICVRPSPLAEWAARQEQKHA